MERGVDMRSFDLMVNDLPIHAVYREVDVERVLVPLLQSWGRRCLKAHRDAKARGERAERFIVLLAAPPGAGKSTLAAALACLAHSIEDMPFVQAIGMDGFHYPQEYLMQHVASTPNGEEVPLSSIKGAPETFDAWAFVEKVRETRYADGPVWWPMYSRELHDVVPDRASIEAPLVIIEGNYLLLDERPWCDLRGLCDASVFIAADEAMLHDRLVNRKVCGGMGLDEAEWFYRTSDRMNVQRVLAGANAADERLMLEPSGRLRARFGRPALAFFDVDGTLVRNERGRDHVNLRPTNRVLKALEQFSAAGNIAVLCTGRPRATLPTALDEGAFVGRVLLAGGYVELFGEEIIRAHMPQAVAVQLLDAFAGIGAPALFEGLDRCIALAPHEQWGPTLFAGLGDCLDAGALRAELSALDICKVVVEGEAVRALGAQIEVLLEHLTLCNIGDDLFELTLPEINKRNGMSAIWNELARRGIKTGPVYGFGDSENDLTMLGAVDTAVVMGNATDEVKAHADYVTDSVQLDGVATALEHFGLC